MTNWQTVLSKLGGAVTISADAATNKPLLEVNDDGSVTVTFEAQFDQEDDMTDAVYNAQTGKFAKTLVYPARTTRRRRRLSRRRTAWWTTI